MASRRIKDRVSIVIVLNNNHCAGFGSATTNALCKMIGLKEVVWDELRQDQLF